MKRLRAPQMCLCFIVSMRAAMARRRETTCRATALLMGTQPSSAASVPGCVSFPLWVQKAGSSRSVHIYSECLLLPGGRAGASGSTAPKSRTLAVRKCGGNGCNPCVCRSSTWFRLLRHTQALRGAGEKD